MKEYFNLKTIALCVLTAVITVFIMNNMKNTDNDSPEESTRGTVIIDHNEDYSRGSIHIDW